MSGIWAITSFFNPAGFVRRRLNYRQFRRQLRIPLVTVELGFDGTYALSPADAEVMVRVAGGDVMWQKERLLNLALLHLPPECSVVAWIDGDVVFEGADWASLAIRALERHRLVQLFSEVHYDEQATDAVHPDQTSPAGRVRRSLGQALASGVEAGAAFGPARAGERAGAYTCGMAWAMRRELLERHRLYDANVLGGGDRAMAGAALGLLDYTTRWSAFSQAQARHFRAWAEPFYQDVQGLVTAIPGRIRHLWHGHLADRRYGIRQQVLGAHGFDPATDIRCEPDGPWTWSSDKESLHRYARDYFIGRREDG